jgi:hypothetical protein
MAGFGGDIWGANGGGVTPVTGPSALQQLLSSAGRSGGIDQSFINHGKTFPDPIQFVNRGAPIFMALQEMAAEPRIFASGTYGCSATAGAGIAGMMIAGLQ